MCLFSFGLIFFIPIVSLEILYKPKIFSQSILVIWASAILQQNIHMLCERGQNFIRPSHKIAFHGGDWWDTYISHESPQKCPKKKNSLYKLWNCHDPASDNLI